MRSLSLGLFMMWVLAITGLMVSNAVRANMVNIRMYCYLPYMQKASH